jgi:hypothetical protein
MSTTAVIQLANALMAVGVPAQPASIIANAILTSSTAYATDGSGNVIGLVGQVGGVAGQTIPLFTPGGIATFPTTEPLTSGVIWLNGNVLQVS